MVLAEWLSLLLICALGAAMPGPSLAVVMQNTLRGGMGQGVITALSHALGVGIYALLTVTGLAVILQTLPTLFWLIQLAGAGFLIYLGVKTFRYTPQQDTAPTEARASHQSAWDGFLIAFLNPKLFIFFTALFSQFVEPDSSWLVKAVMVVTATLIDGAWYCLVAFLLTRGNTAAKLSASRYLHKGFAVILVALGLRLMWLQF